MRVTTWVRRRAGQLSRFAAVGVTGVAVNLVAFNLLRLGPLASDAEVAGDEDRVVTAKVIATLLSIAFAWWAHRGWTFRGGRRHGPSREMALFAAVNAVALVLEAGVVAISHHGLGFTSLVANNIASLIGIGIATVARYTGYALFVFHAEAEESPSDEAEPVTGADAP
ncbi:GtrA family protein [Demequina muriae]|uniref:GtrA family protein n=1 Tax=Demequina muriae TaxID=3051664 RepID=A0ABT8GHT8_9MICO|nr:GtrA family protein [Demequina sp. EGI L300058]MDN4481002.1 GtrA family protein [Demequina sp. EGI L300058]